MGLVATILSIMVDSSAGLCWGQTHQQAVLIQDKDSVTAGSTGASRSAGGEAGSLPRVGGVEGDSQSQGFAGERAPGHLGREQRAGAAQRPACAARREQA